MGFQLLDKSKIEVRAIRFLEQLNEKDEAFRCSPGSFLGFKSGFRKITFFRGYTLKYTSDSIVGEKPSFSHLFGFSWHQGPHK